MTQLYSGAPFWLVRNGLDSARPALAADVRCDVAIIGAGITGALVADALAANGQRVVILERRLAGTGSTSASTALLQYEVDLELHELIDKVGERNAVRAYQLGVEAIGSVAELVRALGDDCELTMLPSLYLASRRRHAARLRRECQVRAAHGLQVEWWDAARVEATYGFPSAGAICSSDGASIDVLRLTRALLTRAVRHGATLHERTSIVDVAHDGRDVQLRSESGAIVQAQYVVYATGYELPPGVDPALVRLHSTYALATEPLTALPTGPAPRWRGDCLVWESTRPYFYMRGTADGRVIAGGEDTPFENETVRDTLLVKKAHRLAERLGRMLNGATFDVAFTWAGTFAETPDGLPYIGAIPGSPRVLVALGYGGNGITFSVIASSILREICLGRVSPDAAIFALDR